MGDVHDCTSPIKLLIQDSVGYDELLFSFRYVLIHFWIQTSVYAGHQPELCFLPPLC